MLVFAGNHEQGLRILSDDYCYSKTESFRLCIILMPDAPPPHLTYVRTSPELLRLREAFVLNE